jgi:hypothetical protein
METLDIGRESAYRRVRGEIPFTFDEVSKLSLELGFSIDEAINGGNINRTYLDLLTNQSDPEVAFLQMFRMYNHFIEHMEKNDKAIIYAMQNRLPLSILTTNELLFKFYYFKYIYQSSGDSFDKSSFSDMVVPAKIVSLREQFLSRLSNIHQFVFIITKSVFLTICRGIQYFYNRKLISDEEVILLQNALYDMLEKIENTIQSGVSDLGVKHYFYLSFMDIESNSACITYGDNIVSQFWIYSSSFVEIRNQEVCYMYKEWFESMRKYAMMISMSNEMYQTKFIEQQRKYIESITKEFSYFK